MSIVRRLLSMFAGSTSRTTTRTTRGRRGGGGLMSIVSRFLGGSRGRTRSTTRL
ncbi:MAG: hypothetical protein KY461_09395 [Actinobacteria bacterium]|nr:hypothetical protein [Actinomycetota bacterium]